MKTVLATAFAAAAAVASPLNFTLGSTDAPSGNKKGLAYNNGAITGILSRSGSATWAYNWGTKLDAPKFQQIPMYWGPSNKGDGNGVLSKIKAGDTPWVLGYNEPDETTANGGCQTSPRDAYNSWGNDMFRFHDKGAKLVCPGISSWNTDKGHTGGPAGLTWLRQFANANNNPAALKCDAQALHWYGENGKNGADQAKLFIDYINYAHGQVNDIFHRDMDLWITEFSPLPTNNAGVLSDFLKIVIPFLDKQPWVARYSPFKAEFLVSGNSLNAAGQTFVNTS